MRRVRCARVTLAWAAVAIVLLGAAAPVASAVEKGPCAAEGACPDDVGPTQPQRGGGPGAPVGPPGPPGPPDDPVGEALDRVVGLLRWLGLKSPVDPTLPDDPTDVVDPGEEDDGDEAGDGGSEDGEDDGGDDGAGDGGDADDGPVGWLIECADRVYEGRPLACAGPWTGPDDAGPGGSPGCAVAAAVPLGAVGDALCPDAPGQDAGAAPDGTSEASAATGATPPRPASRPGLTLTIAFAAAFGSLGLLGAPFPLVRLYRRLRRRQLLEHPARRRAVELVEDDPGLTAAEVAEALGTSYHSARYHLEMLAEFDEVMERKVGGHVRFFPNHGRLPPRVAERVAALREPTRAAVLRAVLDGAGATTSGVGQAVGVAASTASFHLARLEEVGLVRRERDGMCVRHFAVEAAVAGLPDGVLGGGT